MDKAILQELVQGMVEIIKSDIVKVILYGSVARGTNDEESDVDIMIILKNELDSLTEDKLSDFIVDMNLKYVAQTLGKSNTWIFWRITLPNCKQGILAGLVLSFARALGEYGATSMVSGYTPNDTATISTTVYQLWRTGNDALAYKWVFVNIVISFTVLIIINMLEKKAVKD